MYFNTALPVPSRTPAPFPPLVCVAPYHLLDSPVSRPPLRKKPRSKFKFRPPDIVLPRRDHLLAGGSSKLVEQVRRVLVVCWSEPASLPV